MTDVMCVQIFVSNTFCDVGVSFNLMAVLDTMFFFNQETRDIRMR